MFLFAGATRLLLPGFVGAFDNTVRILLNLSLKGLNLIT